LDVKNFFTMDFTNADVESYVNNIDLGSTGMVASIDFFMRILFFKVNLKMSTTAGFYADSAHIPTTIDVPLDATALLNNGSGMLYSWTGQGAKIDQSAPAETMPNANPPLIQKGWEALADAGKAYCKGKACLFRLRGTVGDERFGLDVNLPRVVVDSGFYPQWVGNVAEFKKRMGWDDEPADGPHQIGVFFNSSGLRKGQYQLDQWVRIGSSAEMATACPQTVAVGSLMAFGQAPVVGH
jgi:hypothetical protein